MIPERCPKCGRPTVVEIYYLPISKLSPIATIDCVENDCDWSETYRVTVTVEPEGGRIESEGEDE